MCSRRTILLYLQPSWASIIAISLSLLPSFLSWSNLSSMGILPSSSSGSGKSLTLLTYQMHYFKTSCQESCQEKSRVLPRQFKTSWQEKSRVLPRKNQDFLSGLEPLARSSCQELQEPDLATNCLRSEERRVGKECRSRWS